MLNRRLVRLQRAGSGDGGAGVRDVDDDERWGAGDAVVKKLTRKAVVVVVVVRTVESSAMVLLRGRKLP
jgi:hypothetical protein